MSCVLRVLQTVQQPFALVSCRTTDLPNASMPLAPALPTEIWNLIAEHLGLQDTAVLKGAVLPHIAWADTVVRGRVFLPKGVLQLALF